MSAPLRLDPRGLCEPAEPALIGISGGRDSVALLHALVQVGFRHLVVCHFDHAWREESAREADFVMRLAAGYGLAAVNERLAPPSGKGASPETAGREARLAFFTRVAAEQGIPRLYLAHHADDQVETALWNLFRGSGASGLAGMAPLSRQGPLSLLRPLLGTWRAEIDAYVREHRLEYCEDPTNADLRHTRNRLRHEVIPQIERALGREIRGAVWRAAEILTAEDAWIAASPLLEAPAAELRVGEVRALPLALQRRLLGAWLGSQGVPNVAFADVENVRALLHAARPAKVNLSAGFHARRRAGVLFVEPPESV